MKLTGWLVDILTCVTSKTSRDLNLTRILNILDCEQIWRNYMCVGGHHPKQHPLLMISDKYLSNQTANIGQEVIAKSFVLDSSWVNQLTKPNPGSWIIPATDMRGYSYERQVSREGGWENLKLYKTTPVTTSAEPPLRVDWQQHTIMVAQPSIAP